MKTLLPTALIVFVTLPALADGRGPSLKIFLTANMAEVQKLAGANVKLDLRSADCVSRTVRGEKAGACIITGVAGSSKMLYAVLIGERDENGGMAIRDVQFLKQND